MKRSLFAALVLLGSLLAPLAASATEIRAFITDFTVSPAETSELKGTLKRLLSSRLAGEGISTVDSAAEAEVIVSGSYTQLGKVFSLDAVARTAAGKQLASAFEQGDSLDSLIPAVGSLSAKLRGEIVKRYQALHPSAPQAATAPPAGMAAPAPAAPATASPVPAPALPAPALASVAALPAPAQKAPVAVKVAPKIEKAASSEIVRRESTPGTTSQRIAGAFSALAPVGPGLLVLAEGKTIRLHRQGDKMTLLSEAKLGPRHKILGIDTLYPDQPGSVLLFVTILDDETPDSRIYRVEKDKLKLVQEKLPYLFRAIALNGDPKRLLVQQMGNSDDYYGDLYEASFEDGSLKLKAPIKMPRYANIFNFNTFRDQAGNSFQTVFSESGCLIVYSDQGEELWRSEDKFGGSETYFRRKDANERVTGTPYRTRFIDQRITVTNQGEILVPQNAGFFVVGNQRNYSKYSVVALAWNGSSLEERWRTKQSQNYLADYSYDPASKELLLLEVVQRSGVFGKGGSAIKLLRTE